MSGKQVFISHISPEREVAETIKAGIERDFLGILEVFVSSDRSTIEAGRRWMDEVEAGLTSADVMIVLCSRESVARPWVNFEAGAAWLRGVPIVPLCHSGMRADELPPPLSFLEAIDCGADGLQKLYDLLARTLGARCPAGVDELSAALRRLEQARGTHAIERVERPRVLCAASKQYSTLGFDADVAIMEETFGSNATTVERALTSDRLVDLLTSASYDVVHLVTAIDQREGDLVFDDIDLATEDSSLCTDRLSRDEFAKLLVESGTRLVVLATCKVGLRLGTSVARVANVAACDGDLAIDDAVAWGRFFYEKLKAGRSIHKAFELARDFCKVPMDCVAHRDAVLVVDA